MDIMGDIVEYNTKRFLGTLNFFRINVKNRARFGYLSVLQKKLVNLRNIKPYKANYCNALLYANDLWSRLSNVRNMP